MPKRISNQERIRRIAEHNKKTEIKISKQHEKELVEITKTFIKHCKKINKQYNKKNTTLIYK